MIYKYCTSIYLRIKYKVEKLLACKRDKRTDRKFLIFESDDWGSIRVPSRKVYDELLAEGYAMDKRPYERFDCLEIDDDIRALSEILLKYKDCKGNHPVITLNYLSVNPDFEKITDNGYSEYVYETIDKTYLRYYQSNNVIKEVKKGIVDGVFMPQCHGREHFNVNAWMDALRSGDEDVLCAFRHNMCGIFPKTNPSAGNKFMVALKSTDDSSQESICDAVSESLSLFEKIWGIKSKTFIAPCYTWGDRIERTLSNCDIKLIQSSRIQRYSDHLGRRFRSIGEKNKYGQTYSIRNCFFEPSTSKRPDELNACLNEIKAAFSHGKPAVVSVHRINFVSGLELYNRTRTLQLLDKLLLTVISEYPDVEFVSSPAMINII